VTNVWPTVPLGEVITLSQDEHRVSAASSYPNVGIYSFGRGLFEKPPIEGATTSARSLFRIRAKQFIYSRLFAFEGAYGLVPKAYDGSFVSNEFPSFDVDQERLCPEFLILHFKLPSTWKALAARTVGMGDRRQRIKPEQLLRYEIPLPPVAEQRRIVAKIKRLTAKIDEARAGKASTDQETEALLQAGRRALIGSEPTADWSVLEEAVIDIENGWSPACHNHPAVDGNWGVIKVGSVSFGRFDPTENKELPGALQPRPDLEIKPGDFLMSRANTAELVGACALVHETPPRLLLCDKVFRFVFHSDGRLDPAYLDHVLKSPALREQIVTGATGTSPTMKNIAKAKIMKLRLPLPSLSEQRRIVAYLDGLQAKVDQLKALQAQTRADLDALLPSILDRAFKGEL
jgi:type I restriction enzyme, S subunit